jgi:ribosomal protein L11 methyltransferase
LSPLLRVVVEVPHTLADETAMRLLELSPGGLEVSSSDDSTVLAVYVEAGDEGPLQAAFPTARFGEVAPGWEDAWKDFHHPVEVGGVWIGPPWTSPPPGLPAVVIDPGLAFGTGAHPTTRLCLELVAGQPRGKLLDVGCGSGVLSIAAVRLGFDPVIAIDDDPIAVEVARANAAVNGVALDVRLSDGITDPLPPADIAVVNVLLGPVTSILGRLGTPVAVTSGYLATEQPQVDGWQPLARLELDGWAADVFSSAPQG